jgi:hypothetical protein
MIHRHSSYRQLALAMGLLSIWILFGCAAHKPIWGDPDSGLILTYRAAEGKDTCMKSSLVSFPHVSTRSFSSFPGLKNGSFFDRTFTLYCVFGFLPV